MKGSGLAAGLGKNHPALLGQHLRTSRVVSDTMFDVVGVLHRPPLVEGGNPLVLRGRVGVEGGHVVERATGDTQHFHEIVESKLDLLFEDRLGPPVIAAADLDHEEKVAGADRRLVAVDLARGRRPVGRPHRVWPSFHSLIQAR